MRTGPRRAAWPDRARSARVRPGHEVGDEQPRRPSPMPWLCRDVRRRRQLSVVDGLLDAVHLGLDVGWQLQVVDLVAGPLVGDAECEGAALELALDDVLNRGVGGDVHLLEGTRDD